MTKFILFKQKALDNIVESFCVYWMFVTRFL